MDLVFQDDACDKCRERGESQCEEGPWLGQCITSDGEFYEVHNFN